jgi:hypothetical protein
MAGFSFPDYRLGTQSPQGAIPPLGVDAPVEAFGGGQRAVQLERTADNLGRMSQDFDAMAGRAARAEKAKRERASAAEAMAADDTRVEELNNEGIGRVQAVLHADDGYYRTRGQDAITRAQATWERLREIEKDLLSRAANGYQRQGVAAAFGGRLRDAGEGIRRHVAAQAKEWQKSTALGRQVLIRSEAEASWNDEGKLAGLAEASMSAARGVARIIGEKPGSDLEGILVAQARSEVYRNAVQAGLAGNQYKQALALFDRVKDRIDVGDRQALQSQLHVARIDVLARDYVQRVTSPRDGEPAGIEALHRRATEDNERAWSTDPEQKTANQVRLDAWLQGQRAAIQAAADRLNGEVHDWLTRRRPDGSLQVDPPPPALSSRLSPAERQSLDAVLVHNARGTKAVTDPLVWDGLHRGLTSEDPAERRRAAHVPLWQHLHRLSEADVQTLATLQAEARNGDPKSSVRLRGADRMIDHALRALAADAAMAARFRYAVLGELADLEKDRGRRATPEETQAVVDSQARWVARTSGSNRAPSVAIADVPPEERMRIVEALRRAGRSESDDAIADLYSRRSALDTGTNPVSRTSETIPDATPQQPDRSPKTDPEEGPPIIFPRPDLRDLDRILHPPDPFKEPPPNPNPPTVDPPETPDRAIV